MSDIDLNADEDGVAESAAAAPGEIPVAWRAGRSAAQTAEILRRRAQLLAQPLVVEEAAAVAELVTVDLGAARFGIEADLVREVVPLEDVAPLPGAADFVLGLINVRGVILAAVDLSRVLGIAAPRADWAQAVIVQTARVEVAFAADACAVCRVTENGPIAPPPASTAPFLKAHSGAGIAVLDVDAIVADTQRAMRANAGTEAA